MDCNNFIEKIPQYLEDPNSTLEDNKSFESHKLSCSKCQSIYNEVSLTYNLIDIEKEFDASPFFYHKLMRNLESRRQSKTVNLILTILKPIAVAASIAIGILIGNGEQGILLSSENDLELISESLTPTLPIEYSVWTTLNEDNGSEN